MHFQCAEFFYPDADVVEASIVVDTAVAADAPTCVGSSNTSAFISAADVPGNMRIQ